MRVGRLLANTAPDSAPAFSAIKRLISVEFAGVEPVLGAIGLSATGRLSAHEHIGFLCWTAGQLDSVFPVLPSG